MGQKDGEKWTAAVDLQPTLPKSDSLLDRYGTMFDGLNYEPSADSVRIGFTMTYAAYHEYGTQKMPRRGMLMADPNAGTLGSDDQAAAIDILNGFLQGF